MDHRFGWLLQSGGELEAARWLHSSIYVRRARPVAGQRNLAKLFISTNRHVLCRCGGLGDACTPTWLDWMILSGNPDRLPQKTKSLHED